MTPVGRAVERVEGHAKVTGGARYAADNVLPGMAYGALVLSTVASGAITGIDTARAEAAPGVVAVLTHLSMPRLTKPDAPYPKAFLPLQDATIRHDGQPVAYVVADTLEHAQDAAGLVEVRYEARRPRVVLDDAPGEEYVPPPRPEGPNEFLFGDPAAGLAQADVTVAATYSSPPHHHNPIELSTTVAEWTGGALTLYESTQSIGLTQQVVAQALAIPPAQVRVITPFLGGGFGAKAPVWPHTILTAAVARALRRPVKLQLSRAQMYTACGHQAEFRQQVTLGARRDGRLTALINISTQQLSRTEERLFNTSESAWLVYGSPNRHIKHLGVRLDLPTPHFMRSPEGPALFGLETALDELSYELGIDPVELRLRNYSDVNPENGQPIGNGNLAECCRRAADAFGWWRRNPRPGSMRDGSELIGYGMATEAHTFRSRQSSASVVITPDGRAVARSATHDIGTGTYTVMTQLVAEALGMPLTSVRFELGDTNFPPAGFSATSVTVPSVGGAVDKAARAARDAVLRLAVADPASALHGVPADRIVIENGFLFHAGDRSRRDSYAGVLSRHGQPVEGTGSHTNTAGYTTGAVFVEVRVDPWLGGVRVVRAVGAYDVGRVMNPRTARSQVLGGVTWGVGFALMERTTYDRNTGRVANPNLSTYLIPVNADAPSVEAIFVDRPDPRSPIGAKGFGETPVTGVPAAIGNAVFHATGRRIRDLPITRDKLL
jgi:xanthine dehydrogenase YagR molybdenum-binding subunit